MESVSGPQPLSFNNIEDWNNLWQVIDELRHRRKMPVHYWECLTSVAYDRGDISKEIWYGERIYSNDLLISMEYDLDSSNVRNIYIRRSFARRLKTPVEDKLNLDPTLISEKLSRPYILYFNDHNGNLMGAYPVIHWIELIDVWSSNGVFQPLKS